MKQILKPVGHCLATAVITSTLLRVYPASIAEAASPEPPLPTSSEDAHQTTNDAVEPSAPVPSANALTVNSIVAPAVSGALVSSPSPSPSASSPSPSPLSEAARSPERQPDTHAPVPSAASAEPSRSTAATATDSQTDSQTAQAATQVTPQAQNSITKKTAAKQPSSAQPPTLAAMRQLLDQRLAAIVAQDKASREAQLQQNLISIALRYAETGAFEPARQVARHPALPLELQTALLAQIDQIAAGITPQSQNQPAIAAVPIPATGAEVTGATGATGVGRVVPLHSVVELPASQSWAGSYAVPQCPVPETPAAQTRPISQGKPQVPRFGSQVAATLAATVERLPVQATAGQPTEKPDRPATAKSETAQPAAAQPARQFPRQSGFPNPVTARSAGDAPQLEISAQSRSIAVRPASNSVRLPISSASANQATQGKRPETLSSQTINPQAINSQTINSQTLSSEIAVSKTVNPETAKLDSPQFPFEAAQQNSSPFEVMEYWISKPFKQAGIRLPFFSMLSNNSGIESSGIESSGIESESRVPLLQTPSPFEGIDAEAALSSRSELAQRQSFDLLEPALSLSPYLPNLEQSLADLPIGAKDAVKQSQPAARSTQAQTVSQKTADPAAMNCYSPTGDVPSITISPALSRQMGWKNLVFPLPIPAVLTSAFGWRIHPILGDRRFHAGIDLGAPMGTPVVAAMAGRVVASDYLGGYGLAVIVETAAGSYRTLYGHLSGVAVRPGTAVQQGSVLGWVGSTGNSTGPHLHFETQIPTANGWTAIDPLSAAAGTIASRAGE